MCYIHRNYTCIDVYFFIIYRHEMLSFNYNTAKLYTLNYNTAKLYTAKVSFSQ